MQRPDTMTETSVEHEALMSTLRTLSNLACICAVIAFVVCAWQWTHGLLATWLGPEMGEALLVGTLASTMLVGFIYGHHLRAIRRRRTRAIEAPSELY